MDLLQNKTDRIFKISSISMMFLNKAFPNCLLGEGLHLKQPDMLLCIATFDLLFYVPKSCVHCYLCLMPYSRSGHRQWKTATNSQQPTPDNLITADQESTTITESDTRKYTLQNSTVNNRHLTANNKHLAL
jgi:hypothetical protein